MYLRVRIAEWGVAMGARDLFTPDEWNQIVDAPIEAASLVIMASPSGVLGTAQELLAAYSQRKEQIAPRAASPLLQAIGETLAAREEQERQAAASGAAPAPPDAAELQAETMDG